MWTTLLEGLGGQILQRWALTVLTPAFVFWIGGLVAWVWQFGWAPIEEWIAQQSDAVIIVVAVGGLLIVTASAAVAQRFILPMLRLAEGYWPRPLDFARRALIARNMKQITEGKERWRKLDSRGLDELTAEELQEHARLDQQLMRFPTADNLVMPTRLGNILRSAEIRPKD